MGSALPAHSTRLTKTSFGRKLTFGSKGPHFELKRWYQSWHLGMWALNYVCMLCFHSAIHVQGDVDSFELKNENAWCWIWQSWMPPSSSLRCPRARPAGGAGLYSPQCVKPERPVRPLMNARTSVSNAGVSCWPGWVSLWHTEHARGVAMPAQDLSCLSAIQIQPNYVRGSSPHTCRLNTIAFSGDF